MGNTKNAMFDFILSTWRTKGREAIRAKGKRGERIKKGKGASRSEQRVRSRSLTVMDR